MIGTGIFTIPAFVRVSTESGLSSLAIWAAGAFLALCGAFCYAELATRMPRVGGEYHYLTRIYGPLAGFLSGWMSFLGGFSAAVAAAGIGASGYIAASLGYWDAEAPLIPGIGISQGAALAAGLIICLGLFHSLGIRPGGRLQTLLAVLTLSGICLFVAAGWSSGRGDWSGVWTPTVSQGSWWIALIQVSFAYSGWNAAAYLAGEIRQPKRNLPWALLGGTLAVAFAYISLNLLFLYAIPAQEWRAEIAVGKQAAQVLFGDDGARAIAGLISLAILGAISAMTAAGPRIYFAMARDGLAPRWFSRLNARNGAPTPAILAQCAVAAALALTGAFAALLTYVGSILMLFNALTVAAVYIARRNAPVSPGAFRVPGYPVTPAIFLIVVIVAWTQALVSDPIPTGSALATVLAGFGVYRRGLKQGWLSYQPDKEEEAAEAPAGSLESAGETA